ncbi:MAG: hypothetical protein J0M09_14140 [Xanthomonadales bacterium]|nr:hypothetical protein [Xanthomonadales bacterium]
MDHPENKHASKKHTSPSGQDGEGVRITEHGTRGARSVLLYKTLAVVLAAGGIGYLMMGRQAPSDSGQAVIDERASDRPGIAAMQPTSSGTTAMPRDMTPPPAVPGGDLSSVDLADVIPPGMEPTAAEVIDELHKAGIHSGIGAFNPPGTSPPLIGLAVPEDFQLPEGYVRHYQATDDGQRIEPILMYSPDFEFFDSAGRRIDIPADRVVPPGMAPPGLTSRRITVPPPLPSGKPSP